MRIAHVLSSFGIGGQERVALDLARAQRRAGHEVTAVSISDEPEGPLAEDFRAGDVVVRTVAKRRGFDPTLPLRLARALAGMEVVHTHNPQAMIYGAPAGRLAGARVVHTKHGANPATRRQLWLRRAAGRLVHAFVAVSEVTAEVARRRREAAQVRVIANGIDLSRFAPDPAARAAVRRELGIPDDAWVVGTVGRLVPEKDQALLVRACRPLLGDGYRVVIVGDGPERAALAGEPYVHLAGARRDTPRCYAAFDVFALTSRTEGLPLVLPEAMAAGLPLVATAVGGVPQVVRDGINGYLVPHGDENAIRAALASVKANVRQLGDSARQDALARFSAETMGAAYLRLYAEVGRRRLL